MYNRVGLMGRLAQDPTLKYTASGTPMVIFTLAVDRDYRDQNGERGTDFIDCVAWRKTAEFIGKYFSKGRAALVDGRLQVRHWVDDAGNKRRVTEVLVEDIHFVDSPKRAAAPAAAGYEPLLDETELPWI